MLDMNSIMKETLSLKKVTKEDNKIYLENQIKFFNGIPINSLLKEKIDNFFNFKLDIDNKVKENELLVNIVSTFEDYYSKLYFEDACFLIEGLVTKVKELVADKNKPNCVFIKITNNNTGLNVFLTKFKENTKEIVKIKDNSKKDEIEAEYKKALLSDYSKNNNMILYFFSYFNTFFAIKC